MDLGLCKHSAGSPRLDKMRSFISRWYPIPLAEDLRDMLLLLVKGEGKVGATARGVFDHKLAFHFGHSWRSIYYILESQF